MDSVETRGPSHSRQVWNFVQHYVEMCIAMCVGVALANILLGVADAVGGGAVRDQLPAVAMLVIAVFITLPMVGWMRFRGMEWRPILEMSAAGIVVVIVAAGLGLVSASAVAIGTLCGLECVGMFMAMLFRLDLYTGRSGHHMGHHPQPV